MGKALPHEQSSLRLSASGISASSLPQSIASQGIWSRSLNHWQNQQPTTLPFVHTDTPDSGISSESQSVRQYHIAYGSINNEIIRFYIISHSFPRLLDLSRAHQSDVVFKKFISCTDLSLLIKCTKFDINYRSSSADPESGEA